MGPCLLCRTSHSRRRTFLSKCGQQTFCGDAGLCGIRLRLRRLRDRTARCPRPHPTGGWPVRGRWGPVSARWRPAPAPSGALRGWSAHRAPPAVSAAAARCRSLSAGDPATGDSGSGAPRLATASRIVAASAAVGCRINQHPRKTFGGHILTGKSADGYEMSDKEGKGPPDYPGILSGVRSA